MSNAISIKGLDKAEVLAVLYNSARAQGMGLLHYDPAPMGISEARQMLEGHTYFDYVKGRVLKVDLSGDEFDPSLYDRDNGLGVAQRIINLLRMTGDTNPEEAEVQSLEGTRHAAQEARAHIDEKSHFSSPNTFVVGLGDVTKELKPRLDEILGEEDGTS